MCRDADMQQSITTLTEEVTITPGKRLFPEMEQPTTPSHPSSENYAYFSVTSSSLQLHLEASSTSKGELWANALYVVYCCFYNHIRHTVLLRQHEVRAALAAIKREPQFVGILDFMRTGSTVTQYHIPSQGPPLIQTVTMFYSDASEPESMGFLSLPLRTPLLLLRSCIPLSFLGSLFWVQLGTPKEERSRNSFPIDCIVQMSLGKATRTLQSIAVKADDRCCFTISPSKVICCHSALPHHICCGVRQQPPPPFLCF